MRSSKDHVAVPKWLRARLQILITRVRFPPQKGTVDFFNQRLFEGVLPDCFLTFARKATQPGISARTATPSAAASPSEVRHEINLNPDYFIGESDAEDRLDARP
jgi:hypothetical protein